MPMVEKLDLLFINSVTIKNSCRIFCSQSTEAFLKLPIQIFVLYGNGISNVQVLCTAISSHTH